MGGTEYKQVAGKRRSKKKRKGFNGSRKAVVTGEESSASGSGDVLVDKADDVGSTNMSSTASEKVDDVGCEVSSSA